jgi:hypothetical protein
MLACAACSTGAGYPSLAQRPADVAFANGPAPAAPVAPGVADPAVLRTLARMRAEAMRAHTAFVRSAEAAAHPIEAAHGQPAESEAASAATVALAALDSAHGQTRLALADLDALQARAALAAGAGTDASAQATYAAVAQADADVAALVNAEAAQIAALRPET